MVKYTFKLSERPTRLFDIKIGTHTRKVPFTGYVAFTTKKEATTYAQSERIEGRMCKILVPSLKGKKWYVPFLFPELE